MDMNRGMDAVTDFETHLPPNWFAMLDFIRRRNDKT
jgi:hypothetical protein